MENISNINVLLSLIITSGGIFLGVFVFHMIRLRQVKKTQMKMALRNVSINQYPEEVSDTQETLPEEDSHVSTPDDEDSTLPEHQETRHIDLQTKKEEESISYKEITGLLNRAEILMAQGSLQDAEKILVQILAYDMNNLSALSKLGEIYLANGTYCKSVLLYERLIEENPKDPSVHTNYALSLLHEKDFEKSIFHYEKASELDSQNPERHSNLGQLFYMVKNYDDALECFFNAVNLKPRSVEYLYLVADTYRTANRFPEAKQWYLKILDISPYDKESQKEVERLEALGF